MPTIEIPLTGYPYRNATDEALSNLPEQVVNAYVDELGASVRRPGLASLVTLTNGVKVQGLFYWREKDRLVAVAGGRVYSVTEGMTATDITGTTALHATNLAYFAANSTYLAIANGTFLVTWDGSDSSTTSVPTDSPNPALSVAFLDNYIVVPSTDGLVYYSDGTVGIESPNTWDTTDSFEPATLPDKPVRVFAINRELNIIGNGSVEFWYNSGAAAPASPFALINDVVTQVGCVAPNSAVISDTTAGNLRTLWFLDNRGVIMRLQGRTLDPVGQPIRNFTTGYTQTDCEGMSFTVAGRVFTAFTFPTDNITWVYDEVGQGWAQWGLWNAETGLYDRFQPSCAITIPDWNKVIMGHYSNGTLYSCSVGDYTDDGTLIRVLRQSGHIDFGGALYNKRVLMMAFQVKRGVGISTYDRYTDGALGNSGSLTSRTTTAGLSVGDTVMTVDNATTVVPGMQATITDGVNSDVVLVTGVSSLTVYFNTDLANAYTSGATVTFEYGVSGCKCIITGVSVSDVQQGDPIELTLASGATVTTTVSDITSSSLNLLGINDALTEASTTAGSFVSSYTAAESDPVFTLRFKRDGGPAWLGDRTVALNEEGETQFIARTPQIGMFRTMQVEVSDSNRVDFRLIRCFVDYEVMGS